MFGKLCCANGWVEFNELGCYDRDGVGAFGASAYLYPSFQRAACDIYGDVQRWYAKVSLGLVTDCGCGMNQVSRLPNSNRKIRDDL